MLSGSRSFVTCFRAISAIFQQQTVRILTLQPLRGLRKFFNKKESVHEGSAQRCNFFFALVGSYLKAARHFAAVGVPKKHHAVAVCCVLEMWVSKNTSNRIIGSAYISS